MEPQIIFEDKAIIVVDKPAGMIVHDGEESLAAWLVRHEPSLAKQEWPEPERTGIVHRLDQETSGLLVLAKTTAALLKLQESFKNHKVNKVYRSLVFGQPSPEQGSVNVAIGRHPGRKTAMAVIAVEEVARGKVRAASTDYRVLEKFNETSYVEATIHTGRTHQIRLHLKYLGHPLLGDEVYGIKPSRRLSKTLGVTRQMLHSSKLSFPHPITGQQLSFSANEPADFKAVLEQLRKSRAEA